MTNEIDTACILVVERGVEKIPTIDDDACDAAERAIIAQQPDETPADLAVRVVRRAEELGRRGLQLGSAVFAASEVVSDEVFASRCRMARALVKAMESAPHARLLFIPPSTLSDDGRHELLSIAGTLAMDLCHVPVEVSVRFQQAPPEEIPHSAVRLRKPLPVSAVAAAAS
jgi:hypothetical protein